VALRAVVVGGGIGGTAAAAALARAGIDVRVYEQARQLAEVGAGVSPTPSRFMRPRPLLTVLDEPTAALDAETEHALFERYADQARASRRDGGITVLVSHRFSTVRMADLIVVISDGRVAETGSHEELMARRGAYADLYAIQASAYR
jgi:ABC-type transport system involved in cytochrome bd biosynthesis fused ATPase/permease subunit